MNHRIVSSVLVLAATLATSPAVADPTKVQCIAANDHAQEFRQAGKLGKAREQLVVCVAQSCPGPVRDDCAQRLDEVDKAMPTIVFEVKDASGNDVSAVTVTMDGQPLAQKLNGVAVAVDPGEHRFVFEAAGSPSTERTLLLHEGEKGRRERIVLGAAQPTATLATQPEGKPATQPRGGRTPPVLAIVVGGVGVAGLVVGAVTAVAATSKHGTLQGECNGSVCPPSAQGDLSSFHTLRTVSAIGYVVGAAGILGGAGLWFFAPSRPNDTSARVWVGPASAGVMGAF
ncbi:MAG: hypothetical protein ACLP1X_11695 [Polyangiaceae bacterium]|jgi:hypothetical protein